MAFGVLQNRDADLAINCQKEETPTLFTSYSDNFLIF
jgi:hypothetical protein